MVIHQIRPNNDGELYYDCLPYFFPIFSLVSEMKVQELEVKVR